MTGTETVVFLLFLHAVPHRCQPMCRTELFSAAHDDLTVDDGTLRHGHGGGGDVALHGGGRIQREVVLDVDIALDRAGAQQIARGHVTGHGGVVAEDDHIVDVDITCDAGLTDVQAAGRDIAVYVAAHHDLAVGGQIALQLTGDLHIALGGQLTFQHNAGAR